MRAAGRALTAEDVLEKIRACDVDGVLDAIRRNPRVKTKYYFNRRSVIEAAIILDCLPLLKALLLEVGVKPTKDTVWLRRRQYHYLPLRVSPYIALFVWACDLQKKDIAQFLLEQYVVPLELDLRRMVLADCLTDAAGKNRVDYIDWLVEQGADVNYPKDSSPLVIAASVGANDGINALLAHGSDVDFKGRLGADALWNAVWNRHYDTVRLLMQRGAKPGNARVKQLKKYPEMYPSGNSLDLAMFLKDEQLLEILRAEYAV